MIKCIIGLVFLALALTASGQKTFKQKVDTTEVQPLKEVDIASPVSIINLIATPEKYHGKKIQIIGYLHLEFEGDAIYLHKDDYLNGISANGLWVTFSEKVSNKKDLKDYSDNYVIILGTFNKDDQGHLGLFNGSVLS